MDAYCTCIYMYMYTAAAASTRTCIHAHNQLYTELEVRNMTLYQSHVHVYGGLYMDKKCQTLVHVHI